jgi:SAM-dependent methyltransferase
MRAPDTTTEEYAGDQASTNVRKSVEYLLPIIRRVGARTVLDVGCGVGTMVRTLLEREVDAYGVDLPGLARFWRRSAMPVDRLFCVDSDPFRLPFENGAFDMAYSLGVIEHVGTTDGHADRRNDYHACRQAWLREVFRVVRPGGHALIGGPNRAFPIDVAHGPDSRASQWELTLSGWVGATVHKTWGDNFLWAYGDFERYLRETRYRLEAQSVEGYLGYSRVPGLLRPMVRAYIGGLPNRLRATGFNPWVMALLFKPGEAER